MLSRLASNYLRQLKLDQVTTLQNQENLEYSLQLKLMVGHHCSSLMVVLAFEVLSLDRYVRDAAC